MSYIRVSESTDHQLPGAPRHKNQVYLEFMYTLKRHCLYIQDVQHYPLSLTNLFISHHIPYSSRDIYHLLYPRYHHTHSHHIFPPAYLQSRQHTPVHLHTSLTETKQAYILQTYDSSFLTHLRLPITFINYSIHTFLF